MLDLLWGTNYIFLSSLIKNLSERDQNINSARHAIDRYPNDQCPLDRCPINQYRIALYLHKMKELNYVALCTIQFTLRHTWFHFMSNRAVSNRSVSTWSMFNRSVLCWTCPIEQCPIEPCTIGCYPDEVESTENEEREGEGEEIREIVLGEEGKCQKKFAGLGPQISIYTTRLLTP